jgi:hypothetical protein
MFLPLNTISFVFPVFHFVWASRLRQAVTRHKLSITARNGHGCAKVSISLQCGSVVHHMLVAHVD